MKINKECYFILILSLILPNLLYSQINKIKLDRNPTDTIKSFDTFNQNLLDSLICIEVNVFRRQYGLKPLKFTKFTKEYCKKHSKDMFLKNEVFHNTKELDSIRNNENIHILECCFRGGFYLNIENYIECSKSIVKNWIDSKPHREGLLNKNVTHVVSAHFINKDTNKSTYPFFCTLQLLYE